MGNPAHPVTLSPEQIRILSQRLADLRHNTNNHVAMVLAGVELIRHRPNMAITVAESIAPQPQKVVDEIRGFSEMFEKILGITSD